MRQKIICEHTHSDGVKVQVLEGLNCKENLEVVLSIPEGLRAEFDKPPEVYGKYQMNESTLYFGVNERGVAFYYSYSGPGRGFGGARIEIPVEDGTTHVLIGPWSSRCGVMNHAFQASMEVVLNSRYNMAGAMTFTALNKYLAPMGLQCDMKKHHGDWMPFVRPINANIGSVQ